MSIEINAEAEGLQQSIEYIETIVHLASVIGTGGGEAFLAHLTETGNGPKTLEGVGQLQELADEMGSVAEELLRLMEAQLSVKEASDAIDGEHGDRNFLSGNE